MDHFFGSKHSTPFVRSLLPVYLAASKSQTTVSRQFPVF